MDDHNTETETAHLKAGNSVEIYVMPLLSIPLERWKHPIGHRLPEIAYLQRASKDMGDFEKAFEGYEAF